MFEGDKYYGKIKSRAGDRLAVLRRRISDRRSSKYQSPKVGAYLVCLRNSSVAGAERRGREVDEVQR